MNKLIKKEYVKKQLLNKIDKIRLVSDKYEYQLTDDADFGHDNYYERYIDIQVVKTGEMLEAINDAYNHIDTEDAKSWDKKLDELATRITERINTFEELE
ncbi:hypothetical protein QS460_03410 [Liquorilactobacillus mali]|uniref:Uncharacterized protein n=1 Tax=Liquorilactobacillus mali TaxID=1618 RepID=A0A0R2FFM1_9LACO|nr:hypothetical protein [Liquorilactobacillus mali]KRN27006.1 hypothetical protein IV36_GL001261 [Liquorilactobacillus mali]MDN7144973.1 hypothetical protein [Liquorilactobacillus mali]